MSDHLPTACNVDYAIGLWKRLGLDAVDAVVETAFRTWSDHGDLAQVKAKIGVLNALWEAGVQDVSGWAGHIVEVNGRTPDLAERLARGDLTVVADIATFRTSRQKKPCHQWVAASKYCHFAAPQHYPIWDSAARNAMWCLNGMQKRCPKKVGNLQMANQDFGDYAGWKKAVDRVGALCDSRHSYKQLDQYLWLLNYAWDLRAGAPPDTAHWLTKTLSERGDWQGLIPK